MIKSSAIFTWIVASAGAAGSVFAKFAALLRSGKASGKSIISKFLAEAPNVNRNTVDHVAILKSSRDLTIATKSNDDQPGREKLNRRRWAETGIKMWNPDVHGAGHAALNIKDVPNCCR